MIDTLFRETREPADTDPDRTRAVLHLARQDMSDPSVAQHLIEASRVAVAHTDTRCGLPVDAMAAMAHNELEYEVRPFRITTPPRAHLCETCEASARVDHPDMLGALSPFDGVTLAR